MRRIQFPKCCKCEEEINPILYDDCEKYYLTDKGIMCKDCFIEDSIEWLESNLDEFAGLVEVPVIQVKED